MLTRGTHWLGMWWMGVYCDVPAGVVPSCFMRQHTLMHKMSLWTNSSTAGLTASFTSSFISHFLSFSSSQCCSAPHCNGLSSSPALLSFFTTKIWVTGFHTILDMKCDQVRFHCFVACSSYFNWMKWKEIPIITRERRILTFFFCFSKSKFTR